MTIGAGPDALTQFVTSITDDTKTTSISNYLNGTITCVEFDTPATGKPTLPQMTFKGQKIVEGFMCNVWFSAAFSGPGSKDSGHYYETVDTRVPVGISTTDPSGEEVTALFTNVHVLSAKTIDDNSFKVPPHIKCTSIGSSNDVSVVDATPPGMRSLMNALATQE
eukprot:TRINITY_DN3005_c0_g1_i2.p1 TRINITY_DN3005_c0_g1~~TRINITY_DN3005_c0_g1_i2.p1  ORF type:complete len:165 (-),score=32.83 TRINITY_DN3005_c0_g1_i2:35-529(-)